MLVNRMIRAAMLDTSLYEEVEHDQSATSQAMQVVLIVALASGIGSALWKLLTLNPIDAVTGLVGGILVAVLGWLAWALVTYIIGAKIFGGTATYGEMLRTLGFAQSPNVLLIFTGILGGIPLSWRLAAARPTYLGSPRRPHRDSPGTRRRYRQGGLDRNHRLDCDGHHCGYCRLCVWYRPTGRRGWRYVRHTCHRLRTTVGRKQRASKHRAGFLSSVEGVCGNPSALFSVRRNKPFVPSLTALSLTKGWSMNGLAAGMNEQWVWTLRVSRVRPRYRPMIWYPAST